MVNAPDPKVIVHRGPYAEGVKAGECNATRGEIVSLSEALTRDWPHDAHTYGYSWPEPYRLNDDVIGAPLEMPDGRTYDRPDARAVAMWLDFDAHELEGDALGAWREETRAKVSNLFAAHPGGYAHDTRGGLRVVYTLDASRWPLYCAEDVARLHTYLGASYAHIEQDFGLDPDTCMLTRGQPLRLPRVRRDGIDYVPGWTLGDPRAVAVWPHEPTAKELAAVVVPASSPAGAPLVAATETSTGDPIVDALRARGHACQSTPRGGYCVPCPNARAHSNAYDPDVPRAVYDDSTVALPPSTERPNGGFNCKHDHCDGLTRVVLDQWVKTGALPGDGAQAMTRLHALAEKPARDPVLDRIGADPPKRARRAPKKDHVPAFVPGESPASGKVVQIRLQAVAWELAHDDWAGVLQWDEFRGRILAVDPPVRLDAQKPGAGISDTDIVRIQVWLQSVKSYTAGRETILAAVGIAAELCTFHPVKNYLDNCERSPGILDTAATLIFGADDTCSNDFLKKTMIAAVRRIRHPGTQVDTMPVLVGPREGEGKSSFVRLLFGREFTRSQMPDIESKDASQALHGFWAVEFAEFDRITLKSDANVIRDFITRVDDDYRPPYGKADIRQPRQVTLWGTTNVPTFMRGAGRQRRYWPIPVGEIDLEWLKANRDAMWGEAAYLESQGEPHYYTTAEESSFINAARDDHHEQDPWHESIESYLAGRTFVQPAEIYVALTGSVLGRGDLTKMGRAERNRIATVLERLGCKYKKTESARGFVVPEKYTAAVRVGDLGSRWAGKLAEQVPGGSASARNPEITHSC